MTSPIRSTEQDVGMTAAEMPASETDSIPRIKIRDLMAAALFLSRNEESTLDALRVKLNADRRAHASRTAGYSVARDVAAELDRLGLADVGPLPKDAKGFEKKRDTVLRLTDAGVALAQQLRQKADRGEAYDDVLKRLHEAHPYVRRYIAAVGQGPFLTPVVTSAKQHVSARYTTAKTLADDVAQGSFDTPALLQSLTERIGRPLSPDETSEVEKGITDLVKKLRVAAQEEPQTEFARKMLMAINEIVVPAILRRKGLGFDYNSLRRLWQMSKEFQLAWATSAHPRHDGWLTFATAKIDLSADGCRIEGLRFESSLNRMREGFLDRLYDAYNQMQEWTSESIVTAWEFRATFCFQHRCAPGVFDYLFAENYGGSEIYQIDKDFPRNKPTHEDPVIVGGRQIGLIRITKR